MMLTIQCSGCPATGKGLRRTYMFKGSSRMAQDSPDDWGLRYHGNTRLDFCPVCQIGLGNGSLKLNGATIEKANTAIEEAGANQ